MINYLFYPGYRMGKICFARIEAASRPASIQVLSVEPMVPQPPQKY
jgi:hypothetical protein